MEIIVQLFINALIAAAIYTLIASGLSFIYATTRVFHLAHGVVIAFSGYLLWYCIITLGLSPILGGLIALAGSTLLGLVMNELVYEPLRARKTKGLGYLVATIALLMLGNNTIQAVFGPQQNTIGHISKIHSNSFFSITNLQILILVTTVILIIFLGWFVKYTKFGKAMRAVADNEVVAEVLGIKTVMVRRLTFLVGSFLGGVAGIFYAFEFNIDPNMSVMMSIKGFTAMVIGGAGSMVGALTGSAILGGAEQVGVWFAGAGWKSAMAFVLLFIFLLIRPSGIFGRKKFN